jgi:dephospho-CoA kinase
VSDPDGNLDRAALRRIVFSDEDARRRLEDILHPLIRERIIEQLATTEAPYVLLVVPLLFETRQTDLADRILVVDLAEDEQVRRVRERSGLSDEEIKRILASQCTRSVRLAGADDVIDNSGDLRALRDRVRELHRYYRGSAATRRRGPGDS